MMIPFLPAEGLGLAARSVMVCLACLLPWSSLGQYSGQSSSSACRIESVNFAGWKAQQISNRWIKLIFVPQLGGRLMQVTFGGHPYLFVNPRYRGQYHAPSEATPDHGWFNYGGDKIWPLPEGTQDEQHWPGPIADALDDGEYAFKVLSENARCRIALEGPPDPQTGLQYSREIGIGSDSPAISFHAVMKNITGHPIEWSLQSVSQYDTSGGKAGEVNHDFRAFAPVNMHSAYLEGYHVRAGLASSPAYSVKGSLFTLRWMNLQSEVWLDSSAGWIAVVDGASHYAMVERFEHHESAHYPGKATVIFYSNGAALRLDHDDQPSLTKNDPDDALHYLEAELNSPVVKLAPGEVYAMDTEWFPTRVEGTLAGVMDAGVIASPIQVSAASGAFVLSGSLGVFFPGKLVVNLYDRHGLRSGVAALQSVDPLEPVNLHHEFKAPASTTRISLHVIDETGKDVGALGEETIGSANGGP